MITNKFIATLYMMSGMGAYDWTNAPCSTDRPSGGRRNGGRVKDGMRIALHALQDGTCPVCALPIREALTAVLAHVVGQGKNQKGYIAGNIYLAHAGCNVAQAALAREGDSTTNAQRLARIAQYIDSEVGLTTESNDYGYTLTLTVEDFKRPELIAMEWPGKTVGSFIYFDPNFQGKRKI